MSLSSLSQYAILNNVISQDEQGLFVVEDSLAAMKILMTSDANSPVYKVVTVALQIHNMREQAKLKENQEDMQKIIADGRVKVLDLEKTLQESQDKVKELQTNVDDLQAKEEMRECELGYQEKAKNESWKRIGVGALLTAGVITTLPGICFLVHGIVTFNNKPEDVQWMQDKIELYRKFYAEASFAEAFNYVKENPPKFSKLDSEKFDSIEVYKKANPEATFKDFEDYIFKKICLEKSYLTSRVHPKKMRKFRPGII